MKKNLLPKILITNDDGIHAPGIKHLWSALKDIAVTTIIAPSSEQSSVGASVTLRNPLQIHSVEWPEKSAAWSISGTPADCVKMGLKVILKEKPDLIVSGINRGTNAGRNVLYSGTVGGAIEGIIQGIPSLAFSCSDYHDTNYKKAEAFIQKIIDYILNHPLPLGTLLNVNFPKLESSIKGFKLARQGLEFWGEDPHERKHPGEGNVYYWLGSKLQKFDEHEDSDIVWLSRGYITAVPIHVGELTDMAHYRDSKDHFENHLNKI